MSSACKQKLLTVFFGLCLLLPSAGLAATPRPVDAVFQLAVARTPEGDLACTWNIQPDHYLYRERIAIRGQDGRVLPITTPPGEQKEDPNFGATEVYHDTAQARIPAAALPPSGTIRVSYQGCAARGICYPPVAKTVDLTTLAIAPSSPGPHGAVPRPDDPAEPAPQAMAPQGLSATLAGGLPTLFVTFLGFGLLLALTPCVFPMLPIVSGMLARSGEKLSAGRGAALSGAYVLAMALAYATLGVVAAWSGQNLQLLLQTPLALGLMSLVFVALALSMFGLYDLQLPAAWTSRLSGATAKRNGSIGGAALLGFGSALIVGPCVTPPLAAALLYVAQTGDALRGAAALFALGLGMGLPLLVLGICGSKILPKSGPWLVRVKQAFGFLFIGLGIWMLGRRLPGSVTWALWGGLAIAGGLWLGARHWLPRRNDASRPSLGWKLAGSAIALYGLLLLATAGSDAAGPFPLAALWPHPAARQEPVAGFMREVTTPAAFDAALTAARAEGRPILVDFTADWCVVCREIDRTVLTDPTIRARLKNVSIIRMNLTVNSDASQAMMQRFGVVGPPTLLFLDARTGQEIEHTRTIGLISADQFGRNLDQTGA